MKRDWRVKQEGSAWQGNNRQRLTRKGGRTGFLFVLACFGLALPLLTLAAPPPAPAKVKPVQPEWQTCFQEAGAYYKVAPLLLMAIAAQESSFNPRAVNKNRDGSVDMGLMQINSRWLPALRKKEITAEQLYQPCTSIWVGAWVLAESITRYGYNWKAIGAYNAGTAATPAAEATRERYAQKIHRHLAVLPVDVADDGGLRAASNGLRPAIGSVFSVSLVATQPMQRLPGPDAENVNITDPAGTATAVTPSSVATDLAEGQ